MIHNGVLYNTTVYLLLSDSVKYNTFRQSYKEIVVPKMIKENSVDLEGFNCTNCRIQLKL